SRCVAAYSRRYPKSPSAAQFRERLRVLRARHRRRLAIRVGAAAVVAVAALAGYDALGYQTALAFERSHPAPAVASRWSGMLAWHPSLPWFGPGLDRRARLKQAEWTVKAAEVQVALGTAGPGLRERLAAVQEEAPQLEPAIRKVERDEEQARHDRLWKEA